VLLYFGENLKSFNVELT